MKKLINIISIMMAVLLLFSISENALAQRPGSKSFQRGEKPINKMRGRHGGFRAQLTEEQRQQVQERIQELRDQGATRQEIHQAVTALLESFGIDAPERPQTRRGFRGGMAHPVFEQLTENQRKELRAKIQELRQQNTPREEVQVAIAEMLQNWGVEVPENFGGPMGPRPFPRDGFWAQLTEEQQEELRAQIHDLHEQQVPRDEIAAAVIVMLQNWGIEVPENFNERFLRGPHQRQPLNIWFELTDEQKQTIRQTLLEKISQDVPRDQIHAAVVELLENWGFDMPEHFAQRGFPGERIISQLTEEQKQQLKTKVLELLGQDTSPKEIHDAVAELLQSFGIELPQRPGPGFRGHGRMPQEIWSQLSDEQKQAIHEQIQELREQGATRQEIREAVHEMLEEFGIELPDFGNRGERPNQREKRQGNRFNQSKGKFNSRNYPNPFNPETSISYTLENPEYVSLKIFNMQGQLIKTLVNEKQNSGEYKIEWNGTNDSNVKVVSGVYIYQLNVGKDNFSKKMMLMK